MFGDINFNTKSYKESNIEKIGKIYNHLRKPISDTKRQNMQVGKLYPYYGANGQIGNINDFITDFDMLCIAEDCGIYGKNQHTAYIVRGKSWVNNHAHIFKPNKEFDLDFLYWYFYVLDFKKYINNGIGRDKLTQSNLKKIGIYLPDELLRNEFSAFVKEQDKLKFSLKAEIDKLSEDKQEFISKHFE